MTSATDLLEEIREVRKRLWDEHGGTAEAFAEWIRQRESSHPERMYRKTPRRLTDEEIAEMNRMIGD